MNLLVFGLGYSASRFVCRYGHHFSSITATGRSCIRADAVSPAAGVDRQFFDGKDWSPRLEEALSRASHILVSIPPDGQEDPVLRCFAPVLLQSPALRWVGYLSTVGVYGDAQGQWVDESSPLRPTQKRSIDRVVAENAWLDFGRTSHADIQIFRLSGIYGPGRGPLANLLKGTARCIVKPGHVFNRIHVDDIAGAVWAGLNRPTVGPVINVTDDEPAPPQQVIAYAAAVAGMAAPPDIPFDVADMSPMARSFYQDSKRVSNHLMRTALGYAPAYPGYREGIRACLDEQASDAGKAGRSPEAPAKI